MEQVRWGILGPGRIAGNFADGLAQAEAGRLVAIASRDAGRRAAFGDRYKIAEGLRFDSYEALVADPGIDAVYVATPHPWHAELALLAIRAGKAVLVEKPAGLNLAEVVVLTEAAAQERVFLMEAFMYRCHPQIARLVDQLLDGRSARSGGAADEPLVIGCDNRDTPAEGAFVWDAWMEAGRQRLRHGLRVRAPR